MYEMPHDFCKHNFLLVGKLYPDDQLLILVFGTLIIVY